MDIYILFLTPFINTGNSFQLVDYGFLSRTDEMLALMGGHALKVVGISLWKRYLFIGVVLPHLLFLQRQNSYARIRFSR
ncbi:hypothetical protein [Chlorobium phaeovibrioides]|nr:hypothetical protein [Chlorobium phaeovibrioides]